MQKSQNCLFRNKSVDMAARPQSRGPTPIRTNPKYQLSTLKKSTKPIIVSKQKPVIKLVNHSVNINNYISNTMTNNIIINNYNTPVATEGKSDKIHRKTISLLTPVSRRKEDHTINSSATFEQSETNRNITDVANIVKDLSVDNSIDNIVKDKMNVYSDDILSDSNFFNLDFRKKSNVLKTVSVREEFGSLKDETGLDYLMHRCTMDKFKNLDCYDLSERLINDENKELHNTQDFKGYGFINKIKDEIKHKLINSRNFLEIHENAMFNFLAYAYPFYDKLISTNKVLKKKIHMTLNNKFIQSIHHFRNLYSDYIELQEYYFKPKYIKKHQNNRK
jgi:hypothetical protein